MSRLILIGMAAGMCLLCAPANAASLDISPSPPFLTADSLTVDYLEFDGEGDLSAFDAAITSATAVAPDGEARFSFGIGLREEPDVEALLGARRMGKTIQITLDTNGEDVRGGVKAVALLFRPEITDPDLLLEQYVSTDPLDLDHGDYWT